ncbi:hypothetical protein MNEG_14878, partial [Monoraphidium neglectum]
SPSPMAGPSAPAEAASARVAGARAAPSLARQQAAVLAQVSLALPLCTAFFRWAPARLAAASPALAECAPQALPALLPRLLAASALPLLAGVVLVGNARFLGPGIDPLTHPTGGNARFAVYTRYLSNTLEQYVLHAAATAGLAAWGLCPHAAAAAAWFVAARMAFLVGYLAHPVLRGAGFAATVYPTAASLAYCAWRLANDGPMAGAA